MNCPACERAELREFFDGGFVPVFCNVLYDDPDEARAAEQAEIRLGFCENCAMVFNVAFQPELVEYASGYENSLHGSPRFQAYAEDLASGLVERHGLAGEPIVEIGGGRGEFMELLLDAGAGSGSVFDPSVPCNGDEARRFEVVREYFGAAHLDRPFRLIVTRHVLEHVPRPREFVRVLAGALVDRTGAALYLEIPNGLWTFRDLGIWDIIYEHCSYMAPCTLQSLLAAEGLVSMRVAEAFGGQFLVAESLSDGRSPTAHEGPSMEEAVALAAECVAGFAAHYSERVEYWGARFSEHAQTGRRIAVWGAGSKGITFLNAVAGADATSCVVDINPLKAGRYVAGVGLPIVEPKALHSYDVDEVIVMNPIYVEEIASMLGDLGLSPRVVFVD